jgi:hypothetical protein
MNLIAGSIVNEGQNRRRKPPGLNPAAGRKVCEVQALTE